MIGWLEPGQDVRDVLWHNSGTAGVTGWTTQIFQDGAARTDVDVEITDLASGFYEIYFVPDSEGVWAVMIYETAAPTIHYGDVYLVKSLADLVGGEDYDPASHSLQSIRSAVQIVRDDQLTARNDMNYLPGIGYKKALR